MTDVLKTLVEQQAALEQQIKEVKQASRKDVINAIKEQMELHGITADDLANKGKKADGTVRKVVPKYQDPVSDATWTGRGKQPKWVVEALASGLTLEDLLIEKPAAVSCK